VFVQDPKYLKSRSSAIKLRRPRPLDRRSSVRERRRGGVAGQGYFHHLPGETPFLIECAQSRSSEAAMGGAKTMYPEYRKRLAELSPP
jgi:hypothetical protein